MVRLVSTKDILQALKGFYPCCSSDLWAKDILATQTAKYIVELVAQFVTGKFFQKT